MKCLRLLSFKNAISNNLMDVLVICLLGLCTAIWFKDDLLIAGGDFTFPLSRAKYFHQVLYTWQDFGLGAPSLNSNSNIIPHGIYLILSESIGISLINSEKILFYFLFISAGLSMYYLTHVITHWRLASLSSALFYMFNFYYMSMVLPTFWYYYTFLPLILALYIKALHNKSVKSIFYCAIVWSLTITPAYDNPVPIFLSWFFIFLIFIFYISDKSALRTRFLLSFFLILIWTCLNAYWVIPSTYSLSDRWLAAITPVIPDKDTFVLNSINLLGSLRLEGFWGLTGEYKGDPYYSWYSIYNTAFFIILSFILPLLVFGALLIGNKIYKRYILFFSIIALFSLFMIKGLNPPAESLSYFFLDRMHLMTPFRLVYSKIGPYLVLCYSFLIGIMIDQMYTKIKYKYSKVIFIVLIYVSLFGLLVWPMWTGDIIRDGGNVLPAMRMEVPQDYYNSSIWLDNQSGDYRLLSLPTSKLMGYGAFNWDHGYRGYVGADPSKWIFNQPIVDSGDYGSGIVDSFEKEFKNPKINFANVLSILNIKYIIYHDDAHWQFIEGHSWWYDITKGNYEQELSSKPNISNIINLGAIRIYENKLWENNRFYVPAKFYLFESSDKDPLSIVKIISRDDFLSNSSAVINKDLINNAGIFNLSGFAANDVPGNHNDINYFEENTTLTDNTDYIKPYIIDKYNILLSNTSGVKAINSTKINVTKINPTKYRLDIKTKVPFFLVFKETYHPLWKIYLVEDPGSSDNTLQDALYLTAKPLSQANHFKANGYANMWFLNKTGDYTITLFFWPQSMFYLGIIISILSVIFCLSYLFVNTYLKK